MDLSKYSHSHSSNLVNDCSFSYLIVFKEFVNISIFSECLCKIGVTLKRSSHLL